MDDLKIQVRVKTMYGVERIYPVCDKAKLFAKIVGLVTLSRYRIDRIKELGYSVENILDEKYL